MLGEFGTGIATAVVDASVEECNAYEFFWIQENTKRKLLKEDLSDKSHSSEHNCHLVTTRELGFSLNPREGRSKITWMKEDDGKVIMDVSDTKDVMDDIQ